MDTAEHKIYLQREADFTNGSCRRRSGTPTGVRLRDAATTHPQGIATLAQTDAAKTLKRYNSQSNGVRPGNAAA